MEIPSITSPTSLTIDSILPVYGQSATTILPVWNENQKMFISEQYESAAGNLYYKGVRFSNRIVIAETVGLYHTWTYIDSIEVYKFEGNSKRLIGSHKFEKDFYDSDLIRRTATGIVGDFIKGQCKLTRTEIPNDKIHELADVYVGECYKSFLYDTCQYCLDDVKDLITINNQLQ